MTPAKAPTADRPSSGPAATLWRCGGRTCPPGTCDHDDEVHRDAAGTGRRTGPATEAGTAPSSVHDVLNTSGSPLPEGIRRDMEHRFGHDFADVRIHTDARAGKSAADVSAAAYTVARHIVFAPGEFDPSGRRGRQLIAHELTHAAENRRSASVPSGDIRVSSPGDLGEVRAERTSLAVIHGTALSEKHSLPGGPQRLMRRRSRLVRLNSVSANHPKVTVPPQPNLRLVARPSPRNATAVRFSLQGDSAVIAPGTTIDAATGAITLAANQTGGTAHPEGTQTSTAPDGSTSTVTAPATLFNLIGVPAGIDSTSATVRNNAGSYGGDFTHTFSPPGGSTADALERARVNERFVGQRGTSLRLTGLLGTLNVTVNNPVSLSAGWDLDASATMVAADHVTWDHGVSARPFVQNASNPNPAHTLPQELTARQDFHNLEFPAAAWSQSPVASPTHRRALEERAGLIKAVTSSNAEEVEEDYAGPTVFRNARADPPSVEASAPAPAGGRAPARNTATVQVDQEGERARPTFRISGPALGCRVNAATGVVSIGNAPGAISVRGGSRTNFDEVTITITPIP